MIMSSYDSEVRENWTVGTFELADGPRRVSSPGTLEFVRRASAPPFQIACRQRVFIQNSF